jgi:ADP-heptose:LPS heptosyltransferase
MGMLATAAAGSGTRTRRYSGATSRDPMKLLLWKIGALGDVLMTTPLVRQLRRLLPDARIDYLVGTSSRVALQRNPHLDAVLTFDEGILYRSRPGGLPQVLAKLKGYDMLFVLDKHWIFGLLAGASGARQRVGFRRRWYESFGLTRAVPYGALRHHIEFNFDLAQAAGLAVDRSDVAIEFAGEEAFDVETGTTVLVNAGGANAYETSNVRRMPDALFGELVRRCAAEGPVVFLGSAAESAYYERFAQPACTNLCGRTSFAQAASVLRQARQVITSDNGLMHLASAMNRHVTAVFGPTDPRRVCPPGVRWVWRDAGRHDARYQVFGRLPTGRFFESLTADDVLLGSHASPFDAGDTGAKDA